MSDFNTTDFTNPSSLILLSIPGLEVAQVWISIPFCTIYVIAILGNLSILFIEKREPSLHVPMYYFLCMLAVTDLVLSISIMPKMLSIFWFNSREITFSACLTQLYVIHCFRVMESGNFMAMALDYHVAICDPLRHCSIQTYSMVTKISLALVLSGSMLILPYPLLLRQWPYCRTNIIPQPYCSHIAVVKLAYGDPISVVTKASFFNSGCRVWMEFLLSSLISRSSGIFSLPTMDARLKAFGTCISHLCSFLVFYVPGLFFALSNRFPQNVPLHFHLLIASLFYLMPPMLNPLIYGVRTCGKEGVVPSLKN